MSSIPKRFAGFPVRVFKTQDGETIVATIAHSRGTARRWRMHIPGQKSGFAFGELSNDSVAVNRSLTECAKRFALTEVENTEEVQS